MNAQPVQYVTTSDGWNIAYTISGSGRPFVCLPFAWSHVRMSWRNPSVAPLLQRLAGRFRLIHYDGRGQGLSQHGLPNETSMDSFLLDLEAVIGHLQLERPLLYGDQVGAHVAIRYATKNPAGVSGLILMRCAESHRQRAEWQASMARDNYELFVEMTLGAGSAEPSVVDALKASQSREDFIQRMAAYSASDISALLPQLRVPVLVLHPLDQPWATQNEAMQIAAAIPDARLAVLESSGVWGDPDAALASITEFEATLTEPAAAESQALATVVPGAGISERELEVLRLLAAGRSNAQIAGELVISLNTVNRHVSNIYAKLGAANRAEAASFAVRHGII